MKSSPPRSDNPNKLYSVSQIVFQTIAAVASGCEHRTEMEDFAKDKKEWLAKYIEVSDTMPSSAINSKRDYWCTSGLSVSGEGQSQSVICMQSERHILSPQTTTQEIRYYIGSKFCWMPKRPYRQ